MKTLKLTFALLAFATLVSCGSSTATMDKEGFTSIESDLKSKFGDDAYYTELVISHIESIGNVISTTVTEDPSSLMMGEWSQSQGAWKQTSEITLETPEGTKAADFMFQLNDKINLKKLGELVETSMASLTAEKELENPNLHMAFIKFPDNGDVTNAEYVVMLQPATGGTTFTYSYKLDGELIDMKY
jgi:hypothetical protein